MLPLPGQEPLTLRRLPPHGAYGVQLPAIRTCGRVAPLARPGPAREWPSLRSVTDNASVRPVAAAGDRPRLADVIGALERRYDPAWAEDWDAVGLVCGDPSVEVRSVLFAVDPVEAVANEAIAARVELIVTHHPLFLTPVHGVPADDAKGRLVHRLVQAGCALYVAHTNADVAVPGVSDALAAVLELVDTRPLVAAADDPLDTIVTYVPTDAAEKVIDALAAAGAGRVGNYRRCAFTARGEGTYLPGPGAQPTRGVVGRIERVQEQRIEMVLSRQVQSQVVAALRSVHPYEEPAFSILDLAVGAPNGRGTGRVGALSRPERLEQFVARVAAALPATAVGVRATGDPSALVETVAVCGGAGGSYIGAARAAGADAYVTADLRHHPTSEGLEQDTGGAGRMSMVDVTHWASEWPFLPVAAQLLRADLRTLGATVSTRVSAIVTDPWTLHVSCAAGDRNR